MHGFQLWVNLPQRDKMIRPHYQEIPAAGFPVATSADGSVTVRGDRGRSDGRQGGDRHAHPDHLPALGR